MRQSVAAAVLAFPSLLLTGCSGIGIVDRQHEVLATVVDSSGGADASSEPRLGGLVTQRLIVGRGWPLIPDLLMVRECDATHTRCAMGVAKPYMLVTVRDIDSKSAQVTVHVSYDIGPKQTLTNGLQVSNLTMTTSIPDGVEAIRGHAEISRSGNLPFGELRKIDLPNGVAVGLCINRATVQVFPPSGACNAGTSERFGAALADAEPL